MPSEADGMVGGSFLAGFKDDLLADKVMAGAMAGILGAAARDLVELGLCALGIIKNFCLQHAASMFLPMGVALTEPAAIGVGLAADLTIAGTAGVLFVYFLAWTGPRFIRLKGMFAGAFLWVAIYGALRSWHLGKLEVDQAGPILVSLAGHLLFGLVMGAAIARFGMAALKD